MTRTEDSNTEPTVVDYESQQTPLHKPLPSFNNNNNDNIQRNSPLFDFFYPILLNLWHSIQDANQTLSEFDLSLVGRKMVEMINSTIGFDYVFNMFNLRLLCVAVLFIFSILGDNPPTMTEVICYIFIVILGIYSRVYADPLGMLVYSILNLSLLFNTFSWIEQNQVPLIMVSPYLFMNQFRSFVCIFKFGKEKFKTL